MIGGGGGGGGGGGCCGGEDDTMEGRASGENWPSSRAAAAAAAATLAVRPPWCFLLSPSLSVLLAAVSPSSFSSHCSSEKADRRSGCVRGRAGAGGKATGGGGGKEGRLPCFLSQVFIVIVVVYLRMAV